MYSSPPYSHQADVWVEMLLYLEYKSVIIIHSSDSDGRATLSRFQNLADNANSEFTVYFSIYFNFTLVKIETIIEYEPGISDIAYELQHAKDNFYCRVFILYANSLDAEVIFQEISRQQMDISDYVWIVSEQVRIVTPRARISLKTLTF